MPVRATTKDRQRPQCTCAAFTGAKPHWLGDTIDGRKVRHAGHCGMVQDAWNRRVLHNAQTR
jgi:hypothetical protein